MRRKILFYDFCLLICSIESFFAKKKKKSETYDSPDLVLDNGIFPVVNDHVATQLRHSTRVVPLNDTSRNRRRLTVAVEVESNLLRDHPLQRVVGILLEFQIAWNTLISIIFPELLF